MMRAFIGCALLIAIIAWEGPLDAADPEAQCKIKLAKEGEIWQGQQVILNLTLKTPDNFASAPAFDLPQVSGMILVAPEGRPVLGTEMIGDGNFTTQTYDLMAFPQTAGTITIPSFAIRFDSNAGFGKPVHARTVTTDSVAIKVKRPPGTEQMAIVLTTTELTLTETWKPEPGKDAVATATAFTRTIQITAKQLPGIVLPSFHMPSPSGLRSYDRSPILNDQNERGELIGHRTDLVTIVCERPGDYDLPAMSVAWWNPVEQKLQTAVLSEKTIRVISANPQQTVKTDQAAPASAQSGHSTLIAVITVVIALAAMALGTVWFWPLMKRRWQMHCSSPVAIEARAFRRVVHACHTNDGRVCYNTILGWQQAISLRYGSNKQIGELDNTIPLSVELDRLKAGTYGKPETANSTQWSSTELLNAARQYRRLCKHLRSIDRSLQTLPDLNPTS